MTLKNKISAITAAAMLAFAGVGYAAWTFNNNEAHSVQETAYATSAINAKNVALSGNTTVYLVLDQDHPYWSTAVNNGSKPVELANGKITVTPSYDLQNQNDGASWTYALTSAISVDEEISHYVNVSGFDTTTRNGTITAAGAQTIAAVDYALPTLAYTANKPTNYAEYQDMLTNISAAHITFTFNLAFAEVVA